LPPVYGPGSKGNIRKLDKLVSTGFPLPFRSVNNRRSLLNVANLMSLLIALIEKRSWPFFELNAADPGPIPLPQLLKCVAGSKGKRVFLYPCPVSLLRFVGGLVGARETVEKLVSDFELDLGLMREHFAEVEFVPTEESLMGLREC
jgi:UDP-glucose 4-epimerase